MALRRCTVQITTRTNGNGTVLELNGRLMWGASLAELHNAVRDAALRHPSKIILNLANVTDADFGSIGELIKAYKHVKNQGGRLELMNLPDRVRILLDVAKLSPIFELSDGKQAVIVPAEQQLLQRQLCY